jgi:hypothetical protein
LFGNALIPALGSGSRDAAHVEGGVAEFGYRTVRAFLPGTATHSLRSLQCAGVAVILQALAEAIDCSVCAIRAANRPVRSTGTGEPVAEPKGNLGTPLKDNCLL